MRTYKPVIGQWYQSRVNGVLFEVISTSKDIKSIEIQMFDGEIQSVDRRKWLDCDAIPTESPIDWALPREWAHLIIPADPHEVRVH